MNPFTEVEHTYFPILERYTIPLTRAHGEKHPEVFDVQKLFQSMNIKVKKVGAERPDLSSEFNELRLITNQYSPPSDACETYKAVYSMLKKADETYNS